MARGGSFSWMNLRKQLTKFGARFSFRLTRVRLPTIAIPCLRLIQIGEYHDRRTLKTINCSKTIWIMATNAMDEDIMQFCKKNEGIFDQDDPFKKEMLLDDLT